MKTATKSNPPVSPYSHYIQGLVDDRTFDAIVRLVERTTETSREYATSIVLGAEELIVCRSANGAIEGAHGFRFLDLREGPEMTRIVYAVFSVVDGQAANRRSQFAQVCMRVHGAERARIARASTFWAHAGECDAELALCASRLRPMRQLDSDFDSALPIELRFYTDHFAKDQGLVPKPIESALLELLNAAREAASAMKAQGRQVAA